MNYFEFFGIPEQLTVDEAELKQKFYANSKQFHPDFFTLDDVEKQMDALEQSTINNTAYKTLSNFDKRLHYFLTLHRVLGEEGNNQIPQDFLMDMMEVNEAVMELQFDFDESTYNKILGDLQQTKTTLKDSIKDLLSTSADQLTDDEWEALKSYYLKSKYLIRLEENIKKLKG